MRQSTSSSSSSSRLYAGNGVATNYTWHEEAFEIEVSVKVPCHVRAKDLEFTATRTSIDLRLTTTNNTTTTQEKDKDINNSSTIILLNGCRPLRGRIQLDGTYWVISDSYDDNEHRIVTVTIEKYIANPKDDFQVVDYDWKGVYPDDDDEVIWRKYDQPEPLDVREYAARLGVDIDNINMSMVDKTMFGSGLNLTQASMDQMTKAGLLQEDEVTLQADGKEFTVQDDGTPQAFSPYGNAVHPDEMSTSSTSTTTSSSSRNMGSAKPGAIPFVDTSSPWHTAVPVQNATQIKRMQRNLTRAAFAADAAMTTSSPTKSSSNKSKSDDKTARDPIDTLTKSRLQEILKSQGLPVSGNKEELKQRLRTHVNSLLQGKQKY